MPLMVAIRHREHCMSGRLQDKVCVITGSGGTIGRAACLRFAKEGALVVGCDTQTSTAQETVELVRAAGGEKASLHPPDPTTGHHRPRVVRFPLREHSRIYVLFNKAGRGP